MRIFAVAADYCCAYKSADEELLESFHYYEDGAVHEVMHEKPKPREEMAHHLTAVYKALEKAKCRREEQIHIILDHEELFQLILKLQTSILFGEEGIPWEFKLMESYTLFKWLYLSLSKTSIFLDVSTTTFV